MIAVCISVYNGEKYLIEQFQSIENQSLQSEYIFVIDDHSTDNSRVVIQELIEKTNLPIMYSANKFNMGIKQSYNSLLNQALLLPIKYFMFCDQDDIWHQDKIAKTYQKMVQLEKIYGENMPILIHSDLVVTDRNMATISQSFWKYQNIDPAKDNLNRLLLHNVVTGCTMMINQALAEKVKMIPDEAIMHDWWIAMVASTLGKIAYIDEPLMLYRQHEKNDTGAKQYGLKYFVKKIFAKPSFEKYIVQSKAFLELYGKELNECDRKMLDEFSALDKLNKYQKLKVLFEYKIWKNGFMRNLGLILFT
ncbi:glycosyltransferase family 2 protein [Sulfurospirillum sp.]|uniref:glycosyltransferase family 2 protein n=1 Tax=Sulfurospirillum sp. TaxID=2053622 RepID=UPI002FDCDB09